MKKNRLYLILSIAVLAGYAWLAWSINQEHEHTAFTPCIIKTVTGIPCPSCGTTRSLLAIAGGHLTTAVLINPLGLFAAGLLITLPFWLLYDVVFAKSTLYKSYIGFENTLKIKPVAITLIALVMANWIWNIYKGL